MTWLATKIFFKKVWVWFKHYWYVPVLLIYTLATWIFFRNKSQNILEMFEISKDSYQKEIATINVTHKEEIKKKEKIIQDYHDALKDLQKEYDFKLDELDQEEEEELLNIIKEHEKSPEDLAKEMKRLFGV